MRGLEYADGNIECGSTTNGSRCARARFCGGFLLPWLGIRRCACQRGRHPCAARQLRPGDPTPKPTAEEIEMRRMERVYRAASQAAGTPDRRRRREIRRAKGKV